jgi:uncharacterized protein
MNANAQMPPSFPPFNRDTAIQKVCMAEDGWNTRDPERIAFTYAPGSKRY